MAATDAMVALYSTTLAAATSSVSIAGIPTTGYRDLRLVVTKILTTQANSSTRFNGDAGNNYHAVGMGFNWQPVAGSFTQLNDNSIADHWGYGSTPQGSTTYMDIMDYAATDKHKTALVRFNGMTTDGQWGMDCMAARWASNSAITSITMTLSAGQFAAGSTFELFGIKA